MNIILSIHPKWAKLIYEGKKTIEWRKTTPKRANGFTKIFLYETAPDFSPQQMCENCKKGFKEKIKETKSK